MSIAPTDLKGLDPISLAEQLEAHMGKADHADLLRDCHLAAAALRSLAYEAAKPKEAEGLKLGSRLTVEGVEAVVVPVEPTEAMIDAGFGYDEKHDQLRLGRPLTPEECQAGQYRAMLSAAGEAYSLIAWNGWRAQVDD